MTDPRKCPDCGLVEERRTDDRGRPTTNLDPLSGRCVGCLGREALKRVTFRSRRSARVGEIVDVRALQAGKDAD